MGNIGFDISGLMVVPRSPYHITVRQVTPLFIVLDCEARTYRWIPTGLTHHQQGAVMTFRSFGKTLRLAGIIAITGGMPLAALLTSCSGRDTSLARNGESRYAIVLPRNASPSERHAAEELRSHIALATAAELPVVTEDDHRASEPPRIFVGFGDAAIRALGGTIPVDPDSLGDEGFIIRTLDDAGQPDIVIAGGRLRGTMYGVYTYLDHLGFRWYTTDITRCPEGGDIPVEAINETTIPVFMYREPYIAEAFDGDWAARNRVNSGAAALDETRGGKVTVLGVHTFDQLIPTSLFKEHPEYFPLIGGKRVTGLVQRCLTNPDLVDIAAENLIAWMDATPSQHIFSLSQNDVEKYCECPECKKIMEEEGSPAGLYISFVNKVAEIVEEKHPENYVSTLAYMFTEKPPKTVRPRHNVLIRLCPIYMCAGHPFTECTSPETKQFAETLAGWNRLTDNIFIWHYATDFSSYLAPFPNFRNFTEAIRTYAHSGVRGIFMQGGYTSRGSSDAELRAWVMARLLWEPDADPDTLVDEWMQAVYGQGYRPMREAFDIAHELYADPDRHLRIFSMPGQENWPAATVASLDSLYAEAERRAAADSTALEHIRKARLSTRYVQLFQDSGRLEIADGVLRPAGTTVTMEDYECFMEDLASFGITGLREEPFDCDLPGLLRIRLEEHTVTTLENADVKLDVVPSLGGRIAAITLKGTGERIAGRTDRDGYFYPASGGYEEATTRTWNRTGFANPYTAELNGRALTLTGMGRSGLEFRRTITLPERGTRITIASTITNTSDRPLVARLVCRMELNADPDGATVHTGDTGEPAANFHRDGPSRPRGQWAVVSPEGGWRMDNRFETGDVESCNLECDRKARTVLMEVQGFERDLAPGAHTGLTQTWEIAAGR